MGRGVGGCGGAAGGGGGRSRTQPAAGRVARRGGPATAMDPFPEWLELVRGVGAGACRAVGGGLRSGAALELRRTSCLSRPVLPRRR